MEYLYVSEDPCLSYELQFIIIRCDITSHNVKAAGYGHDCVPQVSPYLCKPFMCSDVPRNWPTSQMVLAITCSSGGGVKAQSESRKILQQFTQIGSQNSCQNSVRVVTNGRSTRNFRVVTSLHYEHESGMSHWHEKMSSMRNSHGKIGGIWRSHLPMRRALLLLLWLWSQGHIKGYLYAYPI